MDEMTARQERLAMLESEGLVAYPHDFAPTTTLKRFCARYCGAGQDGVGIDHRLAGRVTELRVMGKLLFGRLEDQDASLQFSATPNSIGHDAYARLVQLVQRGDILGLATRRAYRTRTGELTVEIAAATLLAKCLRPLPEKYHGLQDKEIARAKRYLDMIVNPESRERVVVRARVVRFIRRLLEDRYGLLEVKTPALQPIYGGAEAHPFTTYHRALKRELYLRISPELYLKRLIVGGLAGVYEICTNFRNEGIDATHYPEFSMMECYIAYADYHTMMALTEELIAGLVRDIHGTYTILWQRLDTGEDVTIDLTPPWARCRLFDALRDATGIDFLALASADDARAAAKDHNIAIDGRADTVGAVAMAVFDQLVAPTLTQPTFIVDYPYDECPLTKQHRTDPRLAERFELYINTLEMANAYSELTDPRAQERQFRLQAERRADGDVEAHLTDEDFLEALQYGMPPTGGLGIGIDRLVMLVTSATNIRDVVLFPLGRQRGDAIDDGCMPEGEPGGNAAR